MAPSINNLPTNVLLEILYKLPQNLIHRCKSVCKLWLSLVSRPCFPAQYLLRTELTPPPNPTVYFFMYRSTNFTTFPLRHATYDDHHKSWSLDSPALSFAFLPLPEPAPRLLCTSNGLALCTTSYDCECVYYVCNPITKHWLTLPPPPTCTTFALVGLVSYGHHFKVVRLVSPCTYTYRMTRIITSSFNAETFDSRTNLWKVSPLITIPRPVLFCKPTNVVEYKGILYWDSTKIDLTASTIMSFDPNLEKFTLTQVLEYRTSYRGASATGVSRSGEGLYHVHMKKEPDWSAVNWRIWRLVDDDDEWCLEHTVKTKDMNLMVDGNCITPDYGFYMLAIDPIDPNVLYFHIRHLFEPRLDSGIISLNIKTGRANSVHFPYYGHDLQPIIFEYRELMAIPFVTPRWPTSLPKMHHKE
ncbi:uncharacterized protein LOC126672980 [Mercurialis annua]|uniref:uncharacterized protein LOC126672980 n=1 Tax=Mercurialis annua TaxID=3986 RepID=UPI0021605AEC|nr:uncharacterized protein LOC126672980 [Mercurialis annua]